MNLILLFTPIIVSLTLAIQLALRSNKEVPLWILSLVLVTSSISYLYFNIFVMSEFDELGQKLNNIMSAWGAITITCVTYPLIVYFFKRIFQIELIKKKEIIGHFGFALTYPLLILIFKTFGTQEIYQRLIGQGIYYFLTILISYTTYYIIIIFRQYNHQLKEFFSNVENKSIHEGRVLFISIIVYSTVNLIYNVFWYHEIIFNENNLNYIHLIRTAFLFIIGNSALEIKFTASRFRILLQRVSKKEETEIDAIMEAPIKETSNKKTTASVKVQELLKEQFEKLMKEEQIFLRKGLTIEQVAEMLKTNRTYLSHMINHYYENSFNTVINEHRVQHAISLYEETRGDYTIEWIARESGFSSPSVFCRTFRVIKGYSASNYFKHYHQSEGLS